jgi:hypothetical protein
VARGGEAGHVGADLGQDGVRGGEADTGDLIEPGYRVRERGDLLRDPGVQGSDVAADRIDAGKHSGEQERVMVGEVAGERLFQQGDLLAQGAPGQLRQHLRAALASDQRGHHVPAGHPEMSVATTLSLI